MIRAALIIDVPFYREGLATLLGQNDDVTIVGSSTDSETAVALVTRERPDVVLLDITAVRARETLAALRALESAPQIVALALNETQDGIAEWAGSGVIGYISRSASLSDLLHCVRCAARGELYCSPRVMSIVLHRFAAFTSQPPQPTMRGDELTLREREILDLVGRGLSNKLIAARLNISHATAKNHVHHILDKLQLRSRAEVAAYLHAIAGKAAGQARPGGG
jgi:two-component system, NarL family, nitrate/nitrite response regulator NarL